MATTVKQMTVKEYRTAVKQAERVIGFISLKVKAGGCPTGWKMSKRVALQIARHMSASELVNAQWATDDQKILFVG